jgi:acyl carrier protein
MNDQEIYDRIKKVAAARLAVSEEQIHPESRYAEDLGADSLGVVDLAMALEDEFQCKIFDADLDRIKTVADTQAYLRTHLGA